MLHVGVKFKGILKAITSGSHLTFLFSCKNLSFNLQATKFSMRIQALVIIRPFLFSLGFFPCVLQVTEQQQCPLDAELQNEQITDSISSSIKGFITAFPIMLLSVILNDATEHLLKSRGLYIFNHGLSQVRANNRVHRVSYNPFKMNLGGIFFFFFLEIRKYLYGS